jgi:hypothetical protein
MSTATEMLAQYLAAESAVLNGKSVLMNGRQLTRENLSEIRQGRMEWERKVNAEKASGKGGSGLYSVADFRE